MRPTRILVDRSKSGSVLVTQAKNVCRLLQTFIYRCARSRRRVANAVPPFCLHSIMVLHGNVGDLCMLSHQFAREVFSVVGEFPPAAVALDGLRSELRSPSSTQYVIVLYNIGNYGGKGRRKSYITEGSVSENVNFTPLLPSTGVRLLAIVMTCR